MKPLFIFPLLFCVAPALAQVEPKNPVPIVAPLPNAPTMAIVTPFITGLKEPQGMALDAQGNLLICDYGAGEILKFSPDGKASGKLATGLKGPSALQSVGRQIFVSERKANRVVRFQNGKMDVVMADIPEPIGLVVDEILIQKGNPSSTVATPFVLTVVSHTTSTIYRSQLATGIDQTGNPIPTEPFIATIAANQQTPFYRAPSVEGARYGFRWLVGDRTTFLMSDEVGERILMLSGGGRVATFASGISDPSGIAIGPDKMVYVANEGDGGQLIRLNSEGEKTVVAEKLGRPRGILFLDAKTVLVSDRDGNVWKVALP